MRNRTPIGPHRSSLQALLLSSLRHAPLERCKRSEAAGQTRPWCAFRSRPCTGADRFWKQSFSVLPGQNRTPSAPPPLPPLAPLPPLPVLRPPISAHFPPPLLLQVVASANGQLRIMIAGAPAAGKGTQCAKIVEKVRPRPAASCGRSGAG